MISTSCSLRLLNEMPWPYYLKKAGHTVVDAVPGCEILLMGIPMIRIPGGYPEAGKEYNRCLWQLAKEKGCGFIPTDENLPLSYDSVHLTEEGHRMVGETVSGFVR